MPTSEEIQARKVKKRVNNVNIEKSEVLKKVGSVVNGADKITKDVTKNLYDIAKNVGKTTVKAFLSSFDKFTPKKTTIGKSRWVSLPIIIVTIITAFTLTILLSTNTENLFYYNLPSLTLLIISFTINAISFISTFSLFTLVFNVIGTFPGIGSNKTGSAMYLSCLSLLFLLTAIILIIIDSIIKVRKK